MAILSMDCELRIVVPDETRDVLLALGWTPPGEVTAVLWNRNGDHPLDGGEATEGDVVRYYRNPFIDGSEVHEFCGRVMHDHGWIDQGDTGVTVCPGSAVVTFPDGSYGVVRPVEQHPGPARGEE